MVMVVIHRLSFAPVAQWIEHPPSKRTVDGSNPSWRVVSLVYGKVSVSNQPYVIKSTQKKSRILLFNLRF